VKCITRFSFSRIGEIPLLNSAIEGKSMKLIFVLLFNLVLALPALAASPVWEVKSGDSVVYVGGTCHILRDSDFPLPAGFDLAYRQSATIIFETDIGELESPAFRQKMMSELFYRDGRSLTDDLSPAAYTALKSYCEKAGLPVSALHPMKPAMVALTLVAYELQKLGFTQAGVDQFFYARAKEDGKRIEGLETTEEQLDFLSVLGKGMEDELIEQSLAELGWTGPIFEDLIGAWKRGDEKEMSRFLVEATREDFPEIYQTLFVKRNAKWLPRIEKFLATPEKELVLVGVGHLVSSKGLIEDLRKRGYEVSQLD
jgi:hypothetical protein